MLKFSLCTAQQLATNDVVSCRKCSNENQSSINRARSREYWNDSMIPDVFAAWTIAIRSPALSPGQVRNRTASSTPCNCSEFAKPWPSWNKASATACTLSLSMLLNVPTKVLMLSMTTQNCTKSLQNLFSSTWSLLSFACSILKVGIAAYNDHLSAEDASKPQLPGKAFNLYKYVKPPAQVNTWLLEFKYGLARYNRAILLLWIAFLIQNRRCRPSEAFKWCKADMTHAVLCEGTWRLKNANSLPIKLSSQQRLQVASLITALHGAQA